MKVAIVGYSCLPLSKDIEMTREESVFISTKSALKSVGLERNEIDTVISASSDFFDGRTISNCMLIDALGAYLKDESKSEGDGLLAVIYAMQRILSGTHKTALVTAHTHSSIFNPHQVSVYMLDPLFDRHNEFLNDVTIAALQANSYMRRYGISEEDLARVSYKNLRTASKNSIAYTKMPDVDVEEILCSKMYAQPLRELMIAPCCDGVASVVLASEDVAYEIVDEPVWIEGVGIAIDNYFRDRDLFRLNSLQKASKMAFKMANISNPYNQIDFAEVTERFSHQELMIYEGIGIAREGKGVNLLNKDVTWTDGDFPVNPSGGALGSGDAICATGLYRLVEAVKQIRDEADNQISGAKTALVHSQWGLAAQMNIILIIRGET
ncbi:MAG: thiolase family protein [Archaeoglobaceae archaeon]|nr:thiolase family protein [Archaeoglobaceae archaeon]